MEDLNGEKISGMYYEKQLQRPNQREFKIKKVIKKKAITYMLTGKVTIICLIAG